MHEEIRFDLLGQRRLVFDDQGVTHITDEIYFVVPMPLVAFSYAVVTNVPILYRDIRWIGIVRKRQMWALALAVVFIPLALFFMVGFVMASQWTIACVCT